MKFSFGFFYPVLAFSSVLIACGKSSDHSGLHSDSMIHMETYASIQSDLQSLASNNKQMASYVVYGTSVAGRDLAMLKIGKAMDTNAERKAVLITEATHGDEMLDLGRHMAHTFLDALHAKDATLPGLERFINDNGIVYIVPVFNPDGYEAHTRENANNVDLNRDYPALMGSAGSGFTQPESKAIGQFLESENAHQVRLKLSVDYHCCNGSILYPWARQPADLHPPADLATFQEIARKVMKPNLGEEFADGIPGHVIGYEPTNTSMDFLYIKYGTLAFAIEGVESTENLRIEKHVKMWDAIFARVEQ